MVVILVVHGQLPKLPAAELPRAVLVEGEVEQEAREADGQQVDGDSGDDLVGAVMGDLAGRRGRVLGTDKVGEDRTVVKAEIPEVELTRYAIDLRSLSHGAGSFPRSFARYEPMPESAAAKVKASA